MGNGLFSRKKPARRVSRKNDLTLEDYIQGQAPTAYNLLNGSDTWEMLILELSRVYAENFRGNSNLNEILCNLEKRIILRKAGKETNKDSKEELFGLYSQLDDELERTDLEEEAQKMAKSPSGEFNRELLEAVKLALGGEGRVARNRI